MFSLEIFYHRESISRGKRRFLENQSEAVRVMVDLGANRALFSISVASEITGVNPQMLRMYEQKGLLAPHRTEGGTRRYTSNELERISEIDALIKTGLNLAGVERVLQLQAENRRLQRKVERLQQED
jgi:MerR family transcriptional regulator/heat shock protein HspR